MGNITSLRSPLLPPFSAAHGHGHWVSDLRFVSRCIRRFERHQVDFGWAVTFDAFRTIYKPPAKSERGSDGGSGGGGNGRAYFIPDSEYKAVWSIWDPGSHGRTDVLQIFAGAILVSQGTYDDKVSMLFELFDMNLDRSITRDEMTIMVRAALSGWCRMIGAAVPDSEELTQIARLAFKSADRQERTDARITLRELILWSHITAECVEILGRFGTTDIEAIRSNQGMTAQQLKAAAAAAATGGSAAAASSTHSPSALTASTSALAIEDTSPSADPDRGVGGGGSKHSFGGLLQGTQNLSAQVDEAAVREREILRLKPSIPTIQELTLREEGKKHAARKRQEMRILSSPRHVNAVSNQPRDNTSAAASASAVAGASSAATAAAAAASSSSPASARSSGESAPLPLPRWHKRIGDMVFLRQNFAACEIAGSGVPVDSAEATQTAATAGTGAASNGSGSGSGSGHTLKMPPIMSRRKSDLTSLTAAAASANLRPTLPCSGFAPLVVFGARMKAHGGRWRRLPAFLTQAGPIQAGEGLSFRDVLRSYFTEYAITKRELDAMVRASEEREAEALLPPKVTLASSIEPLVPAGIGGGGPASPASAQQQQQQPMHAHSQSQPFFSSISSSSSASGGAAIMLSPLSGSLSARSPSSSSSSASAAAATSPSGSSCSSVSPAPVPRALVLKLAQVFDGEDNALDRGCSSGRVSLSALMDILAPSKKLAELIDLQRVMALMNQPIAAAAAAATGPAAGPAPATAAATNGHGRAPSLPALSSVAAAAASASAAGGSTSSAASSSSAAASASPTHASRVVTLPELLSFLFGFSHPLQLAEMLSWVHPLPVSLSPARREQLRRLFARHDRERAGSLAPEELADALREANQGPPLTDEQMQYLLSPFQPPPQSQPQSQSQSQSPSSSSGAASASASSAPKRRADWVTFVRIVRSVIGEGNNSGSGSGSAVAAAAGSQPLSPLQPHPPTSPQQHKQQQPQHSRSASKQQSSSGSLKSRSSM